MVFVLILVTLAGCNKTTDIENILIDKLDFSPHLSGSRNFDSHSEGFFFSDNGVLLFSQYETFETVEISPLYFIDDKPFNPTKPDESQTSKRYTDYLSFDEFLLYGDHIYALYNREYVDGKQTLSLCSLDLKGTNRDCFFEFEEVVDGFFIQNGQVYIYQMTGSSLEDEVTISTLDLQKSVVNELYLISDNLYDIFPIKEDFYYSAIGSDGNTGFRIYNTESKEVTAIYHGSLTAVDQNLVATFSIQNPEEEDREKYVLLSELIDSDTQEVLYQVENERIDYIDKENGYFLTAQVRGEQTFKKYDLSGKLLDSIRVKDYIEDSEIQSTGGFETLDFGGILVAHEDEMIFAAEKPVHTYFKCSFKVPDCQPIYP